MSTAIAAKARAARARRARDGADLVVFSELFLAGYPPEDLGAEAGVSGRLPRRDRTARARDRRRRTGRADRHALGRRRQAHNACALLDDGRIAAIRFKVNLPNYGVFDEKRVFARGPISGPMTLRGIRVGVPICEDIWLEELPEYENIVECLARDRRGNPGGAERLAILRATRNDVRMSSRWRG